MSGGPGVTSGALCELLRNQVPRPRWRRNYWLRLHEREADRCALFPQPLAPPVEGVLFQFASTTVCADRLAARLLLCDSLAPLLTPLLYFVHSSTMPGLPRLGYRGSCDGYDRSDTTQQHNTHIRDLREICYSWHPWHGRAVWVHATFVKRGRAVAHCSLEDVQTSQVLEVPLWMLDVVACCKTRVSRRQ